MQRKQHYDFTLLQDTRRVKGRSTMDQIFSIRSILEKFYEQNINLHQLFVDFKQTYDSISRNKLFEILKEFKIPDKIVKLIKLTLENTKVKVQGRLSREFAVNSGLKQGDVIFQNFLNLRASICGTYYPEFDFKNVTIRIFLFVEKNFYL